MAGKTGKTSSKRKSKTAANKKLAPKKSTQTTPVAIAKHPAQLPSVWHLTRRAALTLWHHKRLFIGITLIYGLLNLILVQGLSSASDISTLKTTLHQVFSGHLGSLGPGLRIFVVLLGSAGNGSSQTAGAYQLILALMASLAVIWALRQLAAGAAFRIRDTYYRGMYPLVPFILVLLVVGLQLVPLVIGSTFYNIVTTNGIAVHFVEKFFWALVFVLLAAVTLYMLCSSLFALYIVTLPDMTPMKALRSARELVRHRRWMVLGRIICLPIILLVITGVIMLPIIVWVTPLTQWVFFLLTMFSVAAVHTYMYTLYRELLNE